jgi:hypothetical protein
MSPDEIAATYEVLAPMAGDYANANIERAGQAQASYGPLAEAAMGGSRTAGIGNYTYNRLARPAVDTMRDELVVQGYSDALNRQLSETLRMAQENYNRAARRHSLKGNGNNTTTTEAGEGQTKINGSEDEEVPAKTGSGETGTINTVPKTARPGEQNVGNAVVNGETRVVTLEPNGWYHISGVGSFPPNSAAWENAKKNFNVTLNPYPGSSPLTTF